MRGSAYDLANARIAGQTHALDEGDVVSAFGADFRVLTVPGHTLGAIAFVGDGLAFTSDTLFLAGCGRVFEGTMPMMHASLRRLSAVEPTTKLFVGHEYTEKNLAFAAHVEPENEVLKRVHAWAKGMTARKEPTMPGTVLAELRVNPFLRAHVPAVQALAHARGDASTIDEVFARLREAKDAF